MEIDSPNAIGESTGFGIPTGGTVNQLLVKNSSTNFDTSWSTPIGSEGLYQAFTGITQGRAVRLGQNGKIYPMDFVGVENQPIIGIAQTSGATNTFIRVILEGGLSTASTGLTPSYNYYASTNGSLTLTGETYVGTAVSGDTLQVWFGNPNGVVTPSLSIIDNSITDPANITIPGRYIVPVSGLTGQFIGEQNDYADYNGIGFTFTTPTNNDKVVITTGPNSGNVYLFASGATSGWTISSQTTTLPTSNWSSGVSYRQFDMVIYQNFIYQANSDIPANTAFNVGTSGATWKALNNGVVAEYNSVYATNGSTTSSGTIADLPGTTLTLPSAGVYRVYYNMYTTGSADGGGAIFSITNSSNTIYDGSNGISIKVPGAATASVASQETTITVSSPTTIKLRWRTNGSGTSTIVNNTTTSNSVFGYVKIAGFAPIIGQTTNYRTALLTTTLVGSGSQDMTGVSSTVGTIPFTSGVWTLTAGVTYQLFCSLTYDAGGSNIVGADTGVFFVDSTTNAALPNQTGALIINESIFGRTILRNGVCSFNYTPSTNQTIKLRVTQQGAAGSLNAQTLITQLGTTNTSAFTGVISPTWNISNSYPLGTMVVNSGVLYQANSFIPANTSFTIGTTGATWSQIGTGKDVPTYIQASKGAGQTLNVGNNVLTSWTNEITSNAGEWNATTGVFTATKAGVYSVSAMLFVSSIAWVATAELSLWTVLNGTISKPGRWFVPTNYTGYAPTVQVTTLVTLSVGNTLSFIVYHNNSTNPTTFTNGTYVTIQEVPSRITR